jgi:hypothetical protein
MKKWIIIAVLVLVAGYAIFANFDARGVERTCLEATLADESGKRFTYLDPDGASVTYEMSSENKIIGLTAGEKIGFSFQRGRFSGALYEEEFYLLSEQQRGRVFEFGIMRTGRGSGTRAAPTQTALPLGCPPD